MLAALLFRLLLHPTFGPGLQAPYDAAVAAWGRRPAVALVAWCDAPGALACDWMESTSVVGYCENGVITISSYLDSRLVQSVMSHEVGHALGVQHVAHGLMSAREWPDPVPDFPSVKDKELLP